MSVFRLGYWLGYGEVFLDRIEEMVGEISSEGLVESSLIFVERSLEILPEAPLLILVLTGGMDVRVLRIVFERDVDSDLLVFSMPAENDRNLAWLNMAPVDVVSSRSGLMSAGTLAVGETMILSGVISSA